MCSMESLIAAPPREPNRADVAKCLARLPDVDANALKCLAESANYQDKRKRLLLKPSERKLVAVVTYHRLLSSFFKMVEVNFSLGASRTFAAESASVHSGFLPPGKWSLRIKTGDKNSSLELTLPDDLLPNRIFGDRYIYFVSRRLSESKEIQTGLRMFVELLLNPWAPAEHYDELSFSQAFYVDYLFRDPCTSTSDLGSILDETMPESDLLNHVLLPLLQFECAVLAGVTVGPALISQCQFCRTTYAFALCPKNTSGTCSDVCTRKLHNATRPGKEWNRKKREVYYKPLKSRRNK